MAMARPLLVVGTGGFARETVAAVRADPDDRFDVVGLLDDNPALEGVSVSAVPVLGPPEMVHDRPDALVVVCTGNPRDFASRYRIVQRLMLHPDRYATVVHPAAALGDGTALGPGTVVLAQTVTTCDVEIGSHVACMPHVTLTHDDSIGSFATVASGVRIGGGACVGVGAYLGAGSLLRERVTVGEWSLVGAGSLVLRDVPAHVVAYGHPAEVAGAASQQIEPLTSTR